MILGIDTSFLVATELASHVRHQAARELLQRLNQAGDTFALAPQVLAEFVHVVTDPRRCSVPLPISAAMDRTEVIWNATQVLQVFPDAVATSQFVHWMRQHRLGRKRLLDTLLGATYWIAGIRSVVTLNHADFALFGFSIIEP
jgi:predicted nucleic acid-binding protein